MRFHFLRPVTAYSRVIFAQISGDFERVCSQVSELARLRVSERSETPIVRYAGRRDRADKRNAAETSKMAWL